MVIEKPVGDSDEEDHEKEEKAPVVPPDYEAIETYYRFDYVNFKKFRKEFPENNRQNEIKGHVRYKSGVPPAPRPKQKRIDGVSIRTFEKLMKFYFKVSEVEIEKIKG